MAKSVDDIGSGIEFNRFRYFLGVIKEEGTLPVDYPVPYEESLLTLLMDHFGTRYEEVLAELIQSGELAEIFRVSYSEETGSFNTTLLDSYLRNRFNTQWVSEVKAGLDEALEEMWHLGTEYVQGEADDEYEPGVEPELEEDEQEYLLQLVLVTMAATLAGSVDQIILPVVTDAIVQAIAESLDANFVLERLLEAMQAGVDPRSLTYYDMLSVTAVNTTRNMGRLYQANVLQMEYLYWHTAGDEKVCGRCGPLEGMKFAVEGLMKIADDFLAATTTEGAKEAMPWPVQSGDDFLLPSGETIPMGSEPDDLLDAGIGLPPLHGRCRCSLEPGAP